MGGRIVDRLNSGHHVSSSYGRNLLRIDRADHGRLCLHDSRLARPESCTHQILSKPEHRCSHIADIALCRIPRYSDQAARRPTSRQPHGGVTTIGRDRTVSPSCRPAVGENLLYAFKAPGKVGRTHSSGESAPLRAARCPAGGVTTSGHHEAQRTSSGRRQAPSPGAATGNASPFDPAGTGHRTGSRLRVQSVASGSGPSPIEDPPAGLRPSCGPQAGLDHCRWVRHARG
jgi:hypothetical protein